MASVAFSEKKFGRLHDSIQWSERQLEVHRKKRIESINMMLGAHYAEKENKRTIINSLKMAVDIYVRTLVPCVPRAMVSSKNMQLRSIAQNLGLALDQIPDEIDLEDTLRDFVTEALFSIGVIRVGLHTVGEAMGLPYGASYADCITMDDYFLDMSAKKANQIQYEGNSYWMDFDKIKDADWIIKKARKDLKPDEHKVIGVNGEERAEGIATSESAEVFRDRIWLRDVWVPDEGLIVTYGVTSKKILNVIERDGPGKSPYIKLGFSKVPGNLLPFPPVSVWRDLHELGNAIYRKLANQADSEKTVLGFSGDDEGATNFRDAKDGDGIKYTGTEPKKLTAGGINQATLAFSLQNNGLFSYFSGNIDSLGGLSAITETVGQDRLLSEAAGAQMRDMGGMVSKAYRKVFRSLAYYEWNDPIKRRTLEKPIEGTDIVVPTAWGPDAKRGDFEDYDIDIDVYSLQDNTPSVKLQKLGAITQNYIIPMEPMISAAGGTIDVQAILRDVGKFSGMPEIEEYVVFMEPENKDQQVAPASAPANTTRTYERVGKPGMTDKGLANSMQQTLLSQAPQGSGADQGGG